MRGNSYCSAAGNRVAPTVDGTKCQGYGSSASSEYRVIELEPNNDSSNSPFPRNRITSSKYTVWNFVPKNLFEQFRRVGNFYFLVTAIVAASIKSPISSLTSSLPLLFVILVTACKQGYEDLLRYRSDRRVNNLPVTVIRRKCSQEIRCQQIVVGDLVRVNRDDDVPCDLVILHSSESSGKCYVTTSNLDGETNLKTLLVPKTFANLEIEQVISMKATITCQQPIAGLYTFEGRVQASIPREDSVEEEVRQGPLGIENIVLRGARLKDTDCVLGCAVYTGRDTKLSLNSKLSINKFSSVEKSINKYVLIFIAFLILEVCFTTVMKVIVESSARWDVYLGKLNSSIYANVHNDILSFTILFNYVVPISLYVTIELQKFMGSFFFSWDLRMYDESTKQPAIANTSDLNEDLGQVEYLFSDKTGTLTENLMIFRRCFIDGYAYLEKDCNGNLYLLPQNGTETDVQKIGMWTPEIWHFMLSISICHTVHIAPDSQKAKAQMKRVEFRESFRLKKIVRLNSSLMMHPDLPEYQAASADEKALVEAAARCGVVYQGDGNKDEIKIDAKGTELRFYRLDTLEFNSDRKRMSVIVRDTAGDIWLYCKGADTAVFPLVHQGKLESGKISVDDFSMRGLRTLVIGFKKFTEDEYQRHSREISSARQTIGIDRTRGIDSAYLNVENGLTLLGVTAVEDRLQEGVPETMEKLRIAGIKIWVLTGDKAETAENIAFFCGHFKKGTKVLRLMAMKSIPMCYGVLTSFERKLKLDPFVQYGLLVDGISAGIALKNCPSLLRNVGMACEAVVCCRMSPLQKSQIVHLVKRARGRPLTAAIGDGGNDVSMIKEAHVGLGITGKEGCQAAMSADFAFAKFMHLDRALLVHGHWYYLRVAVLTQYFFYKNLVFITPQLFFSIYNGFSGQALYDSIFLMCFNIFFSSVPILVYGIIEQNYPDEKLLKFPQLYQLHKKNYLLSPSQFLLWIFMAIWQTCTIYFISHYHYIYNPILFDGTPADHWCFSTCIFHLVTLVINLQLLVLSSYWTIPFALSIITTELFFFAFTFFYSFWNLQYDGNMYRVFPRLMLSPTFWILTVLVITICLIPTYALVMYQNSRPSRIRGQLESREDSISEIIYSPAERISIASPVLPNRRSSTVVPWRGNFSCYDNKAF
ncbi:probable phospholipid-transporting ATPase IF isoform X1 [Nasonia vitripennis]|uniref:Phospholipid-transporting ATPase n=2 Tax=Nasonia vitripennis TaxID=7425 RepID=A0A7M7HET5_NASVI|nr:probable phospholipid-transporting ATPase IF isoform X1 [Nasonia vitripennis]